MIHLYTFYIIVLLFIPGGGFSYGPGRSGLGIPGNPYTEASGMSKLRSFLILLFVIKH